MFMGFEDFKNSENKQNLHVHEPRHVVSFKTDILRQFQWLKLILTYFSFQVYQENMNTQNVKKNSLTWFLWNSPQNSPHELFWTNLNFAAFQFIFL